MNCNIELCLFCGLPIEPSTNKHPFYHDWCMESQKVIDDTRGPTKLNKWQRSAIEMQLRKKRKKK